MCKDTEKCKVDMQIQKDKYTCSHSCVEGTKIALFTEVKSSIEVSRTQKGIKVGKWEVR